MVKLNQLDLNEVHYFVRVVQEGSLSAASRYLQIPKSKISRKLTDFEKKVGHPLIKRNTRSLTLTDEGRKLYENISTNLSEMIQQLDDSLSPGAELSGQLRIAIPSGLGLGPFMEIVGLFRKKNPGVRIHIQLTDKAVGLLKEDFDLALHIGPVKQESLVSVSIASMDLFLFGSAEYVRKRGIPMKPEDLAGHDFIGLTNESSRKLAWPLTSTTGRVEELVLGSGLTVNLPQAVKFAILGHQGLGFLPWMLANPEWESGEIVRVLPQWRVKEIPLAFVYHKHKTKNQKIRAFVNFMKSEVHRCTPGDLNNRC